MAHVKLETGQVVVDWTTGDPEGDRKHLFSAYTDFIKEIESCMYLPEGIDHAIKETFKKWQVSTENQVDDFPRIWIKRPV